jgi:FkbM family methyltransferase
LSTTKIFEIRPGLDALRYLSSFGFLSLLARRAARRPQRFFVGIVSSIDRHVITEGLFEKGIIELLKRMCLTTGRTDLMIDIGANIGNHTVALAPLFRNVESIEPHPVLFKVLEANVLQNRLAHVRCHNIGLASENVDATLTETCSEHGLSRVKERSQLRPEFFGLSAESFGSAFGVQLRAAGDFLSQFASRLDRAFIKIDVEGMEEEIIRSIAPLLERHKPLVAFEWVTHSQPRLADVVGTIPGYELWGICLHGVSARRAWRLVKTLFRGRYYTLERIDARQLDEVYPLAVLVPVTG